MCGCFIKGRNVDVGYVEAIWFLENASAVGVLVKYTRSPSLRKATGEKSLTKYMIPFGQLVPSLKKIT